MHWTTIPVRSKYNRFMNLRSSSNSCAYMSQVGWEKFCKTKVWYFGLEFTIKENVTCFNIPMNNMWLDFLMKECKPSCNSNAYFAPCRPTEFDTAMASTLRINEKYNLSCLKTKTMDEWRAYREVFVQGCYSQGSHRPKFYGFHLHNNHTI